jgi:hypothetical protein
MRLVSIHRMAHFVTAAVLLSVTLVGQQPPPQGPPPGERGGPPGERGGPGGRRGGFPPFVDPNKKILLIGDRPSHGPGEHEHNAAVWLLQKALTKLPGITATASFNGWPADAQLIDQADAIFLVCDGGARHVAFQEQRSEALKRAAARGAGLMFTHYCVEPPEDRGRAEMLDWIGGYFEVHYSVNPHWEAAFKAFPGHPITRGVKPFTLRDEWYYNMRFREGMKGVVPLLTATPPAETLSRPDGPHSGNPDVRAKAGQPTVLAWAFDTGTRRGVGLTGGHFHQNFADESFRKLVLNAVLWTANIEVPPQGVTYAISAEELNERRDVKPARGRGPGRGPMEP